MSVQVTERGVGVLLIWKGLAATAVPRAGLPGLTMKRQKTAVTVSFVGATVPVMAALLEVTESEEITPSWGGETFVRKLSMVGDAAVPDASVAKNA